MSDLFGVLCVLTIVLAIVTVVGHGIWLLLAAMLKSVAGSAERGPVAGTRCYFCSATSSVVDGECRSCGAVAHVAAPSAVVADLQATARQLDRMLENNRLDRTQHARLMFIIRSDLAKRGAALPLENPQFRAASTGTAQDESNVEPDAAQLGAAGVAQRPVVEISAADVEIIEDVEIVEAEPAGADSLAAAGAPPSGDAPSRHPLDQAETAPAPPRRALAELLQGFMDEKNIRWGELVSGILIVGCAVGLVISLRATLSEWVPYFPALLFMLVTAAIHFSGIYTLRRWNLQNTSRGVLIIGTLLVPLNFVAAIVLSGSGEQLRDVTDPAYLVAVFVGLTAFGSMTYLSSTALAPRSWPWIWIGVMGASAGQLIINRPEFDWLPAAGLLALPLAAFVGAVLAQSWRVAHWPGLSSKRAEETFLVLSLGAFAFLTTLGLLVAKSDDVRETLAEVSPLLSLAAASVITIGLAIHSRASADKLAVVRTVGTSLALLGGALMGGAMWCAWPRPELLIAVGLVNFGLLSAAAVAARLPTLHGVAIANGAFACLVFYHLLTGGFEEIAGELASRHAELLLTGQSCIALLLLACATAGAGFALLNSGRDGDAATYMRTAAGLGAVSTLLALVVGFLHDTSFFHDTPASPDLTTIVMGVAAAGLLAVGARLRHRYVVAGFVTMLWITLVHSLAYNTHVQAALAEFAIDLQRPVLAATLIEALACAGLAVAFRFLGRRPSTNVKLLSKTESNVVITLIAGAWIATLAAAPFAVQVEEQKFGWSAGYMASIAVVWLVGAILTRQSGAFAVFQAAASTVLAFSVAEVCRQRGWGEGWIADARHIYAQLGVMSVWAIVWAVTRKWTEQKSAERFEFARRLIAGARPAVDEVLLAVVVAAVVGLSLLGCLPQVFNELGIDAFTAEAAEKFLTFAAPTSAWIALGLTVLALAASLWQRPTSATVAGLVFVAVAAPVLIAARFGAESAAASALRWGLAVYFVVVAGLLCSRKVLQSAADLRGWRAWSEVTRQSYPALRALAVVLGAAGVLLLTTIVVARVPLLNPPNGTSILTQMGSAISYATPLLLVVVGLAAFAVVDRIPGFALAGSLVLQYVLALACLLPVLTDPNKDFTSQVAAQLGQLAAIGLAGYSLAWLAIRNRLDRGREPTTELSTPLGVQMFLTLLAPMLLSAWGAAVIFLWPDNPGDAVAQLGAAGGYIGWALALAACVWFAGDMRDKLIERMGGAFLLALGALAAASCASTIGAQNWLAYHVLTIAWSAAAGVATLAACWTPLSAAWSKAIGGDSSGGRADTGWNSLTTSHHLTAIIAGGLVLLLATGGCLDDPQAPWWSAGAVAATSLLAGCLAAGRRSQLIAYLATGLGSLASTYLWLGDWHSNYPQALLELLQLNLLAALVWAGVWLAFEIGSQQRRNQSFDGKFGGPPVHRIVCVGAAWITMLASCFGFAVTMILDPLGGIDISNLPALLVLIGLAAVLIASLWDRRATYAIGAMYVAGIAVLATTIHAVVWDLAGHVGMLQRAWQSPQWLYLAATLGLAGYVAFTGYLWRRSGELALLGAKCGISDPAAAQRSTRAWLGGVNLSLGLVASLMALAALLFLGARDLRIAAAFAPALAAFGIAGSAWSQPRGAALRLVALLAACGSAVLLSWADVYGEQTQWMASLWLTRIFRMLMVLSAGTLLYAAIASRLARREGDWFTPVRRAAAVVGAAAVTALAATLLFEVVLFMPEQGVIVDDVLIDGVQVAAVAIVLTALVAGLVTLALLPSRDPLSLSEQGRTAYVYAAQAVAALLFAHIYLARPMWFGGVLQQYWPFIVMIIAFAGVGASELFRRSGIRVLAEPFERTAAFMPLLPAVGMWVIASQSDYSAVLLVVGLLYVLLAMLRKSLSHALAAAVAGNAALWALLTESEGLGFVEHPQFWLIPPAVSVLVATHLNRHKLPEDQVAFARYMCIVTIYLSSASEMFIQGLGEQLWPPMVLCMLAILGVFAGIALKIRAFLYLGTSFIFLSVISMVWHAWRVVDHMWPWWVFGIGMGVLILVVFGLFEKKRDEFTLVISRMRQWEQ